MLEVLRSGRLALGPKTQEFERLVAGFTGSPWAAAVSSGTAGLHLAVRALDIGTGDCVVTSSFSFIASANCIRFEDAEPVFLDIDPMTRCLSTEALRAFLEVHCKAEDDGTLRDPNTGRRVAAVLPVDVFGHPVNLDDVHAITQPFGVPVISDSCEALGSRWRRSDGSIVHAGATADVSVFAFYPNKQIATGEGGMVVGLDDDVRDDVITERNQGRTPGDPWLHHARHGFNYRIDELSAALGVAQMRRIDEILEKRAAVAAWYEEVFADVDEIQTPTAAEWAEPAWFVEHLRVAPGIDRNALVASLNARGVEAKAYFEPPIHRQPPYEGRDDLVPAPLPETEDASRRTLIVPFFSRMSPEQVEAVGRAVRESLPEART